MTPAEVKAMGLLLKRLSLTKNDLNFDNGVPIYFMTMQIELSQLIDKV